MQNIRIALLALAFFFNGSIAADEAIVRDTAERLIRQQTQGYGKVTVNMGAVNTSKLPPCSAYEAFAPPGTRFSGKTYIGVRCLGPSIWSVLVPAQIAVSGNYVTTTRPLAAGATLQPEDLAISNGDTSNLPNGFVTDLNSSVGKTLKNSVGAGQPLRKDLLLSPFVIRQGQAVRVVSKGAGFAVSSEGKAINNAASGQVAQVRLNSGQTVSGIAKSDGTVEISF
jgi:flagella basal body P-ring formation protein FlgA